MKYFVLLIQVCMLTSAIGQQVEIDSVIGLSRDAIRIVYAGGAGVHVQDARSTGVWVSNAGVDGVWVYSAGADGVFVEYVGRDGFHVGNTGRDGFHVEYADDDGFYVFSAGGDGVRVFDAGNDGVYVGNAGGFSMNIQGNKNQPPVPASHIAQIYNRSAGSGSDVLALKVGKTAPIGGGVNFITFYDGNDAAAGRIEGNGIGGVLYGTSGADFAECLTPLSKHELIEAGDIVGIYEGKVSLRTRGATAVMVITDRPAVLGNQKEESTDDENVSFVGQVFVNVRGQVNAGDWIVASGLEDGTGIAVAPSEITLDHQIVGRAWESNTDTGIKKVNTAVGLDNSAAKDVIIRNMDNKIKEQQESIDDLQKQIDELKRFIIKE